MNAGISLLGLAGVSVVLYGLWQSFMVDATRQRLFQIRDEIFDKAADGVIAFNSPEYIAVRGLLNSMIRHCHDFTWLQFLLAIKLAHRLPTPAKPLQEMLERIENIELKGLLKTKVRDASLYMIAMAWLRSPLILLATVIIIPVIGLFVLIRFGGWNDGKEFLSRAGEKIQEETLISETITTVSAT